MALKMSKTPVKRPKLPKGGDRFLWNELPVMKQEPTPKKQYQKILRFDKRD